ncbi:MAG: sugar ABC transporter ATP-binding protein [Synergistaceae bacterium]|jgi:ribose transport system ATP-binding protein|nr:sugar ABC transporter ATP-binding protein [Synergistaceae bacterium]
MNDRKDRTVLRIENVSKQFPGVKALSDVTMEAYGGEITGLIGVNGAGKSTLMNILGGVYPATAGRILVDGDEIHIHSPQDAERHGIGFIHQEPLMFNYMTVAENISISKMRGVVSYREINAAAAKYLAMMGCDIKPTARVGRLPIGDRQMVEIARALSTGGMILLFDEPTASFAYKEKERLFEVIRNLKAQGSVIFFISHFLDEVEELTDKTIVLRDGQVALQGNTKEIKRSDILRNMVGGDISKLDDDYVSNEERVVFRIKGLSAGHAPRNVDLELRRGEIVGLWGLMGSGRTELMRTIYGLDRADAGEVMIETGGELKNISFDKVRNFCGYVTEARHDDGLFLPWSIWENIAAPNLKSFLNLGGITLDFKAQRRAAEEYASKLNVKARGVDVKMEALSGGNQQKVIMAKWLLRNPMVFLLDEPTRGVDVGAKAEIHRMIKTLSKSGTAILMVSSEIEEISALSDRVLVLNRGRVTAEVKKEDIDKELLMSYCV